MRIRTGVRTVAVAPAARGVNRVGVMRTLGAAGVALLLVAGTAAGLARRGSSPWPRRAHGFCP